VRLVGEPIDQRFAQPRIGDHLRPLGERPVLVVQASRAARLVTETAPSPCAEVEKNALCLYEALMEETEGGQQFLTREKDGVASPLRVFVSVSVREQIESLESVSSTLLNSLNLLPICAPCIVLGALDVDPGEPRSL